MTKVRLVAASSDTLLVTGNGSLQEDWLRQTRAIKCLSIGEYESYFKLTFLLLAWNLQAEIAN